MPFGGMLGGALGLAGGKSNAMQRGMMPMTNMMPRGGQQQGRGLGPSMQGMGQMMGGMGQQMGMGGQRPQMGTPPMQRPPMPQPQMGAAMPWMQQGRGQQGPMMHDMRYRGPMGQGQGNTGYGGGLGPSGASNMQQMLQQMMQQYGGYPQGNPQKAVIG